MSASDTRTRLGLRPTLYAKNLSGSLLRAAGEWSPSRFSHSVVGGPDAATLAVRGNDDALWAMVNLLRCPATISDRRADLRWWGFINEVAIRVGAYIIRVSLDGVYSRVSAAYSNVEAGTEVVGERATTAWAQDDDSIAEFGYKEWLVSANDASQAVAEAKRDVELALRRRPRLKFEDAGNAGETSAEVACRGWYYTLDWRLYQNAAGAVTYTDQGNGVQTFGRTAAEQQVAQSFQLSGSVGWNAANMRVRCRRFGTPADNMVLAICADSAGSPGTALGSVSVTGTTVPDALNWLKANLATQIPLALSTTYWLRCSRSGALDTVNYYEVDLNTALGMTSGSFRINNAGVWQARSPDADMVFEVGGYQETTRQIERLVTTAGQFITGVDIETASGRYSNEFRSGDQRALYELEKLLNAGTSDGRRLLAMVTPQRRLRVYAEPAQTATNPHWLTRDKRLLLPIGGAVDPAECKTGVWARLKDVIAASANSGYLADASMVFIDQAEYDVAGDAVRYVFRDDSKPFEIVDLEG